MRWGRGLYLLAWLALCAAQYFAVTSFAGQPGAIIGAVLALQLAKAAATIPRLNDLGMDPSDAVLSLVPLGNLRLFIECTRATPKPAVRARRMQAFAGQSIAASLFRQGFASMVKNPLLLVGGALVYGAGFTATDIAVTRLLAYAPTTEDGGTTLGQVLVGIGVLCVLYTGIQLTKRATASRASWWPSLLTVPLVLIGLSIMMGGAAGNADPTDIAAMMASDALIVSILAGTGALLLWDMFAGAALALLIVDRAQADRSDTEAPQATGMGRLTRQYTDVLAPYGGMVLAITVGMLIIVPGILYALFYAFVPAVSLTNTTDPALKTSSARTRPYRRRLFVLMTMGVLVGMVSGLAIGLGVEAAFAGTEDLGGRALTTFVFLARQLPASATGLSTPALIAAMGGTALGWMSAHAGIAHLYFEDSERRAEAA